MLKIWVLTSLGRKLTHSVNAPDSPPYRIITLLGKRGGTTNEGIAEECGLGTDEAGKWLSVLRRKRIITDVTEETQ